MKLLLLLSLASLLQAETLITFWTGTHPRAELAQWAMERWAAASGGALQVKKVTTAEEAEIRFYWVDPLRRGLYGQALSFRKDGKELADVVINPSVDSLGEDMKAAVAKDPLYADVILFLTCVHESGHALGLLHTRKYEEIMYSFEHGGDFTEYFARFRRRLKTFEDIRQTSPLAPGDIVQLKWQMAQRTQNGTRSPAPPPNPRP
ncbi:matrixin family metalloprotease [Bryobacter aggregatus]|uniref:matrixin family metalloprotease n=1 Tax=Bryobacter aggregatus TaxID=360054 RepID=UPI0004E179CB|nr:matrixin family metalloprotease [Bryobacter aggregatus]